MMTMMLRAVLIFVSVGTMAMMIQKIRKAKLQIEDAIFWTLVSLMFVVFSLFPSVADFLAHLVGIYATTNFLFLFIIFLLLLRVFSMTLRMSQLETKLKELVQQMALYELEQEEQAAEAAAGKSCGEAAGAGAGKNCGRAAEAEAGKSCGEASEARDGKEGRI
ncbi:MAG: DUF2304 domain-containing protein [Lachnospiraceae bacterium]|nr:DUF2304 domain-containing protein [Lachnospiraceae bacterium]